MAKIFREGRFNWFSLYALIDKFKLGHTITIKPTAVCNLKCSYCSFEMSIGRKPNYSELEYLEWLEVIKAFEQTHGTVKRVNVSGGEPFIYSDIIPLLESLTKCYTVTIFSNLLSNKLLKMKANRKIRVKASYHDFQLYKFLENLKKYRRIFQVDVWEFPTTYQKITGSIKKEFQKSNEERDCDQFLFAPNGDMFKSHPELEKNENLKWSINMKERAYTDSIQPTTGAK